MKLFHDFCPKFEIDNQIVYGRHHSTHLRQTYRILKRNHCKEHVCIAGLFHSIYDKDSIYKNKGADYSERNIVTQFLGTGSEQLIYFYSLFHPTRNFAKTEGDDEVTSMENSDGKISISTAELSSLSDIFIADIVEQIIWCVEKKKIFHYKDAIPHLEKIKPLRRFCSPGLGELFDRYWRLVYQ